MDISSLPQSHGSSTNRLADSGVRTPPRASGTTSAITGSNHQSSPTKLASPSTLSGANVDEIKNNYAQQLRDHVDHVDLNAFLLFLLSMASDCTDKETLQVRLREMIDDAVTMCQTPSWNHIITLLRTFSKTKGTETALYPPWVKLSNAILAQLVDTPLPNPSSFPFRSLPAPSDSLIFQCNDPKVIQSAHTGADQYLLHKDIQRKPDVIGLDISSALETRKSAVKVDDFEQAWRQHAKDYAPRQPDRAPSSFGRIHTAVEFKRTVKDLTPVPRAFQNNLDEPGREKFHIHGDKRQRESDANMTSSAKRRRVDEAGNSADADTSTHRMASIAVEGQINSQKLPPDVQIGIYSGKYLSSCVAYDHVLQSVVINDKMWLWWFDRGGAVVSSGFNIITDLPIFIVVLAILQRFNKHDWGLHPKFESLEASLERFAVNTPFHGPSGSEFDVEINASAPRNLSLFGRGTATVSVTVPNRPAFMNGEMESAELIAKISYPDEGRKSEVDILCGAYGVAAKDDEDAQFVRGHLPILVGYLDDGRPPYAAKLDLLDIKDGKKGRRVLRILLFVKLKPITELVGKEFGAAFRDCMICHGILWKHKIHHRDISVSNLMYARTKDGKVLGVLNDFDLAITLDDARKLAKERAGTLPFMAGALLRAFGTDDKVAHIYEYDVESFGYVLRWITVRYENGKVVDHTRLATWLQLPTTLPAIDMLAAKKEEDLWTASDPTESYASIEDFVMDFTKNIHDSIELAMWNTTKNRVAKTLKQHRDRASEPRGPELQAQATESRAPESEPPAPIGFPADVYDKYVEILLRHFALDDGTTPSDGSFYKLWQCHQASSMITSRIATYPVPAMNS